MPFWVAVLVPFWVPAKKVGRLQWVGLILAFCGVAVALSDGLSQGGTVHLRGDALAVAAGLFWGLTTVVIRTSVLARISAEKLLFYQVGMSILILPWVSMALDDEWQPLWSSFAIHIHGHLNGFRRFYQLHDLDVVVGALPRNQNFGLRVFNASIRFAHRQLLVGLGYYADFGVGLGSRCCRNVVGEP